MLEIEAQVSGLEFRGILSVCVLRDVGNSPEKVPRRGTGPETGVKPGNLLTSVLGSEAAFQDSLGRSPISVNLF